MRDSREKRKQRERPEPEWVKGFLDVLEMSGNVSMACRAVGIGNHNVYKRRKTHPEFRERWETAKAEYKARKIEALTVADLARAREIAEAKERFLGVLHSRPVAGSAARAAGVSRSTVYVWRKEDPEFAKAWDEARADAIDNLEIKMYRDALAGDMNTARWLLRFWRPDEYGEKFAFDHRHKGRVAMSVKPDLSELADDTLAQLRRFMDMVGDDEAKLKALLRAAGLE